MTYAYAAIPIFALLAVGLALWSDYRLSRRRPPPQRCPHGHLDHDDCPDCCH